MDVKKRQQLILVTGTPSIGKSTTAKILFEMLNNSAHLDGDWLWNVNPFSLKDPRLRNGDRSMSFALSTYLQSSFDYVVFSSCILVDEKIRKNIIADIDYTSFSTVVFWLSCSPNSLKSRYYGQESSGEPAYSWLELAPHSNDIVIDTDNKEAEEVSKEMYEYIMESKPR